MALVRAISVWYTFVPQKGRVSKSGSGAPGRALLGQRLARPNMTQLTRFRSADAWRTALGLLPIPLRVDLPDSERYVLLNGTTGNFCLDFIGGNDRQSQRAMAWSCDVGHYVTAVEDTITVNRWDRNTSEERYSLGSVVARLHEFHRHLEKTTPDRAKSIGAHVLRLFRRIRTSLDEQDNGRRSLRVLLHLLASAAAGHHRLEGDALGAFGLDEDIAATSRALPDATWTLLCNDLSGTGRYDVLQADYELVLRHASGLIFQDAHLEAVTSPDPWLPGMEGPVAIGRLQVPNDAGVYFTPPALARTLAEEATVSITSQLGRTLAIFDPACGSGELLRESLRLLKLRGFAGRVRALGWDKSAAAVDLARFVMAWEGRNWAEGRLEHEILQRDSLTSDAWPSDIDILVMNPPFKAWTKMDASEQEIVTGILGRTYRPNMSMAFVKRAANCLAPGGALATIVPNSMLEASSARPLRNELSEIFEPQLVARLGDQTIFSRALVDAGMYVGRRRPAQAVTPAVVWADSQPSSLNHALRALRRWRGAEVEPLSGDGYSVYSRSDIGTSAHPWIARSIDAWRAFERAKRTRSVIPARRLFEVHQGARLGNDVFILRDDQLGKIPPTERQFFRPAVMNPSIVDGRLNSRYHVFYPYTDGLPLLDAESSLLQHVPRYYQDYLLPAKDKLAARKNLERQGLNWWDLLRPRAWQAIRGPKIVSKYFGVGHPFAFDEPGDFVVVVGNAWLLKTGTISEVRISEREVYYTLLAYLNSKTAEDLLGFMSIQVAGGQWDLSNKYVGDLPVPNVMRLNERDLGTLIDFGVKVSKGAIDRWADLDEAVASIIGG